jgi:two-component system, OmpR family, sensor kinase
MSIAGRVLAFQLILTLAVACMAATAYFGVRGANYYVERVQLSRRQVDAVTELAIRANRFSEQIAELLLVGEPERPDFENARAQMLVQFRVLAELSDEELAFVQGDEAANERLEAQRLHQMIDLFHEIDRAVERVLLLVQQNRSEEAVALFRAEIENRLDADFEALIAEALADERSEVAEADAAAKRLSSRVMVGTFTLLGLLLALAIVSGFVFTRSLRKPINALAEGTNAIERGDLTHRIAYAKRDEFGVLAGRFNTMAEKLQRQTGDLLAARANLEQQVEERTRQIADANLQLTKLDQQRVRFLGDVSHELRTPLTVLRAEAEVALRGSSKPENTYRAALATVVTQAANMSKLVEDLLFLARSEADEVRFDFQRVAIADIVSQAVQDASVLARDRDMRISIDYAEPGPVVRADPRRLKQALVVVLENAARYADPRTGIEVDVRPNGAGHAEIRVRDHGPGIPDDEIPYVFDRFYRGSAAQEHAEGSGLGLSIARWIVEKHEGTIELSSAPGDGTEARLSLPLMA